MKKKIKVYVYKTPYGDIRAYEGDLKLGVDHDWKHLGEGELEIDVPEEWKPRELLVSDKLDEALLDCVKSLRDILSTVSLDWYVQQFAQSETSQGMSSGIVAKIHNSELRSRTVRAFENARNSLKRYEELRND